MICFQRLRKHAKLQYGLLRQQCYSQYVLLWNLHYAAESLFLFWSVWFCPQIGSKRRAAAMEACKQTGSTEIDYTQRCDKTRVKQESEETHRLSHWAEIKQVLKTRLFLFSLFHHEWTGVGVGGSAPLAPHTHRAQQKRDRQNWGHLHSVRNCKGKRF